MLPTDERNKNTDKNLKASDQRKNRLESDLQVEATSRNTGKRKN